MKVVNNVNKNKMKFSEGLFKFPIKVYDTLSVTKAILREDLKFKELSTEEEIDNFEEDELDWVRGYARIPINEIKGWTDVFAEGKNVKEVAEEGFEETMVITKTMGNFECLWKMERFEVEIDRFAEMYTRGIENLVDTAMKEKAESMPIKKKKFW
jgi:hypothetical protein